MIILLRSNISYEFEINNYTLRNGMEQSLEIEKYKICHSNKRQKKKKKKKKGRLWKQRTHYGLENGKLITKGHVTVQKDPISLTRQLHIR